MANPGESSFQWSGSSTGLKAAIISTIPDKIGMLFRKELVMFGPRELLFTSEEKDDPIAAQEQELADAGISGGGTKDDFSEIIAQVQPNPGMPERNASTRHRQRVEDMLHTLPEGAQTAIRNSMDAEDELKRENQNAAAKQGNGNQGGQGGQNQGAVNTEKQFAGSNDNTEQFPAYQPGAHQS